MIGLNATSPAYWLAAVIGAMAALVGVYAPGEALLDAAARHDATMIVVGTTGESPLNDAVLGSTPHRLLHLSDRPVRCVPVDGR